MRIFVWLVRAAIFFTLFAFALNNLEPATVKWFSGYEWRAPMVFIVLAAFGLGCAFGIFAMVPSWWRHRRIARTRTRRSDDTPGALASVGAEAALVPQHPPRDGL